MQRVLVAVWVTYQLVIARRLLRIAREEPVASGTYHALDAQRAQHGELLAKRLQVYETSEITVTFDPNVCIHSGVCVRGLPAVFDIKRKRWVRPELATAEQVAAQVSRCPSGALQYQLKTGGGAPSRAGGI